ncbi:MAG: hypothetical protein AAB263_01295, partial [Planctomycetota bacterium]
RELDDEPGHSDFLVDASGRNTSSIKEDYTNLVGLAPNEDLVVLDVSHALMDPLHIKTYTESTQQEELRRDLRTLKEKKVKYNVQGGIISSLLVEAKDAELACALLHIHVPTTQDPSLN